VKLQDPNRIIIAGKKKKDAIRLFVDLDGVCSDFDTAAAKLCDIDLEDEGIREHLKGNGRIDKYISDEEMWNRIRKEGEDWWANMEILPWAKDLYDMLKKESPMVAFLSSPSNNPSCASGKLMWIKKHFDTKDFIISPRKQFCAGPNTLLIDDTLKKVKEFRKYGGHAFLWPSPLAIMDGDKDIDDVLKELKNYIREIK